MWPVGKCFSSYYGFRLCCLLYLRIIICSWKETGREREKDWVRIETILVRCESFLWVQKKWLWRATTLEWGYSRWNKWDPEKNNVSGLSHWTEGLADRLRPIARGKVCGGSKTERPIRVTFSKDGLVWHWDARLGTVGRGDALMRVSPGKRLLFSWILGTSYCISFKWNTLHYLLL